MAVKTKNASPDWKKNKTPLYVWIRQTTKKKLKDEARARELPLRRMVSEILERAITQL